MNLRNKLERIINVTSQEPPKDSKIARFSYIDPDVVIELMHSGLKCEQISKIYGCHRNTLYRHMKEEYPDFDARDHILYGRYDITPEQTAQLYNELKSLELVSERLGLSVCGVVTRLDEMGVKRSTTHRRDLTEEKVVRLYKKYKKIPVVAQILKASPNTIRRRLEKAGVEIDLSYRHDLRRTDIPTKEVLKLYDQGKSINSLAKKYHCCHGTIRRIVVNSKRAVREQQDYMRKDLTLERVSYWYSRLKRVYKVAKKLNTTPMIIRDRLRKAGVEIDQTSFIKRRKRPDIKISGVLKLRQKGMSITEIARKKKSSWLTIKRILDGHWDE